MLEVQSYKYACLVETILLWNWQRQGFSVREGNKRNPRCPQCLSSTTSGCCCVPFWRTPNITATVLQKPSQKKNHNQIKQQVRHGSPFKFTKSTTSKAPARRVLEVSNRNMSNVSNVWKFWPIRTDVVLQTSNPRHTVSPGSATEFAKLWTNHLR